MAKQTRSERIQGRVDKLRGRGKNVQGQYMADLLEKSIQDPTQAAMSTQERGGMALEAGAAAGAASAPAMQQLAEAGMMGDKAALAGAATQIQQGASQGAYQGALAAEQADQQRVQTAEQEKQAAQQAAIQEQVRKRQQVMSDISAGLEIATQAASLVMPSAYGLTKNIGNMLSDNEGMGAPKPGQVIGGAFKSMFGKKDKTATPMATDLLESDQLPGV